MGRRWLLTSVSPRLGLGLVPHPRAVHRQVLGEIAGLNAQQSTTWPPWVLVSVTTLPGTQAQEPCRGRREQSRFHARGSSLRTDVNPVIVNSAVRMPQTQRLIWRVRARRGLDDVVGFPRLPAASRHILRRTILQAAIVLAVQAPLPAHAQGDPLPSWESRAGQAGRRSLGISCRA